MKRQKLLELLLNYSQKFSQCCKMQIAFGFCTHFKYKFTNNCHCGILNAWRKKTYKINLQHRRQKKQKNQRSRKENQVININVER